LERKFLGTKGWGNESFLPGNLGTNVPHRDPSLRMKGLGLEKSGYRGVSAQCGVTGQLVDMPACGIVKGQFNLEKYVA